MKKTFICSFIVLFIFGFVGGSFAAGDIACWFPPSWKSKRGQAKTIAEALSGRSGITVKPRIATSYPEILEAFGNEQPALVYVGSFVQAIIRARDLGFPLVQSINGKEFYAGVLIYPKGKDPEAILKESPEEIAFAVGASSGESAAKAATGGQAKIATRNHGATAGAVKAGKAKGGMVKNWWWESNKQKYPMLEAYNVPGISEVKNPDNVLTASKVVSEDMRKKIYEAAIASKDVFAAREMAAFDPKKLDFPLALMEKGKINPRTYTW